MARICVVILDHRNDSYLQDLVDGVHLFCPRADIAWYNSGQEPPAPGTPASMLPMLPNSRPLQYAKVTPFFFDVFEWAAGKDYDYVINAETDMAFVQPGYERFIATAMRNLDYLAPGFVRGTPKTSRWRPYRSLRPELPEMLALLGLDYTNRCFSPGQVFSARYIERVMMSSRYDELRGFIARNQQAGKSFSLQEVLLPTLADALALKVRDYPPHLASLNRYRPCHAAASIVRARTMGDAYFVHPVRREEDDPARQIVRRLVRPTATAGERI